MHLRYSMALTTAAISAPALGAGVDIKLELPRMAVAEYHRPYVAMWVEKPDQGFAANLAVWYDIRKKNNEGTKWLKDMRQWWRKSGRELQMPVDGISGATRAPGEHAVSIDATKSLAGLAAGDYLLVVEAAREAGGRELVRIPFAWPPRSALSLKAQGEHELGAVSIELKP